MILSLLEGECAPVMKSNDAVRYRPIPFAIERVNEVFDKGMISRAVTNAYWKIMPVHCPSDNV